MRIFWLTLWAGCLVTQVSAAPIVGFQVSNLGTNLFRYTYFLSGVTFPANQELDVFFDPLLYGSLSNGKAPSGFDVLLVQPNNPPGTFGEYSVLALVNNPSLAGTFSVDFTFLKPGQQPGPQPFAIGTFSTNGFNNIPGSPGVTTPQAATNVPEPTSLLLAAVGILMGGVFWSVRKQAAK